MRISSHILPIGLSTIASAAVGLVLGGVVLYGVTGFEAAEVSHVEGGIGAEHERRAERDAPPAPTAVSMASAPQTSESTAADSEPVNAGSRDVAVAHVGAIIGRSNVGVADDRSVNVDGASLLSLLPQSLIELARSTTWDGRSGEALEQFMLVAFDADGDGTLDDFERIIAVRSLRDAIWPAQSGEAASVSLPIGAAVPFAEIDEASLNSADLLLHHDADESRRLDDGIGRETGDAEPHANSSEIDDTLRGIVIERFRLDDDGQLTIAEYARFLRFYRSGSAVADLNFDGRVDHADLHRFLDVASPIPN